MPNTTIQPICPKCSEHLVLVRTIPFKDHEDIEDRTYECPKCKHSEGWVFKGR
jgi:DNA-directed RNA polymerase subunit RPC12/RpoP